MVEWWALESETGTSQRTFLPRASEAAGFTIMGSTAASHDGRALDELVMSRAL